ncbi:MAG: hypothetical protein ACRC0Y_08890 [Fusobacteriaceae bacterium]
MLEKDFYRLSELAKNFADEKMLEFLQLYVILKSEQRKTEEILPIISLKEFFEGVIEARLENERGV